MNIAVCDDEENIRYLIKRLIEKQDVSCQIMEFSSGEELLRFWEQEDREQLDILFLDISKSLSMSAAAPWRIIWEPWNGCPCRG